MRAATYRAGTRKAKRSAVKAKARPAFAHRPKNAPAPPKGTWLSVKEAAETLALSPTTVRNRANSGAWPSRNNGRLEVFVRD